MGRLLVALGSRDSQHKIVGALEAHGNSALGSDAGELAGVGKIGVKITDDYASIAKPDTVTLDFTTAPASMEHLEVASKAGAAIVIGSTGFTPETEARAKALAQRTRTVIAPNMSIGVNVLMKITAEVARILSNFDAEVIEIHHNTKVDAPSGTALKFGQIISGVMGQKEQRHGRSGRPGQRPHGEIGYHALRVGDNPGEHTIVFGLLGETIELTVRATNRDCYAHGALSAAKWLAGRKPGLYSMQDVLGI